MLSNWTTDAVPGGGATSSACVVDFRYAVVDFRYAGVAGPSQAPYDIRAFRFLLSINCVLDAEATI